MILATWNRLWTMHDDVKNRIMFFVKPNASKIGSIEKNNENENNEKEEEPKSYKPTQLIGLFLGPLLFLSILLFFKPADLSAEGVAILASTVWVATWWITEAVSIPVTSLLPLVLFPLTNGLEMKLTASSYGDETIFLFMGGFMIALAMEKWNLHRRIALAIISLIGTNTNRIILGFMVATGFLSMWISNTATASMMYPIMGSLAIALGYHPFALMIAAGVSASCAFMLPVATPPNAVVFGSGYLRIPDMIKKGLPLNFIGIFLVTILIYFVLPYAWGIELDVIPEAFLK